MFWSAIFLIILEIVKTIAMNQSEGHDRSSYNSSPIENYSASSSLIILPQLHDPSELNTVDESFLNGSKIEKPSLEYDYNEYNSSQTMKMINEYNISTSTPQTNEINLKFTNSTVKQTTEAWNSQNKEKWDLFLTKYTSAVKQTTETSTDALAFDSKNLRSQNNSNLEQTIQISTQNYFTKLGIMTDKSSHHPLNLDLKTSIFWKYDQISNITEPTVSVQSIDVTKSYFSSHNSNSSETTIGNTTTVVNEVLNESKIVALKNNTNTNEMNGILYSTNHDNFIQNNSNEFINVLVPTTTQLHLVNFSSGLNSTQQTINLSSNTYSEDTFSTNSSSISSTISSTLYISNITLNETEINIIITNFTTERSLSESTLDSMFSNTLPKMNESFQPQLNKSNINTLLINSSTIPSIIDVNIGKPSTEIATETYFLIKKEPLMNSTFLSSTSIPTRNTLNNSNHPKIQKPLEEDNFSLNSSTSTISSFFNVNFNETYNNTSSKFHTTLSPTILTGVYNKTNFTPFISKNILQNSSERNFQNIETIINHVQYVNTLPTEFSNIIINSTEMKSNFKQNKTTNSFFESIIIKKNQKTKDQKSTLKIKTQSKGIHFITNPTTESFTTTTVPYYKSYHVLELFDGRSSCGIDNGSLIISTQLDHVPYSSVSQWYLKKHSLENSLITIVFHTTLTSADWFLTGLDYKFRRVLLQLVLHNIETLVQKSISIKKIDKQFPLENRMKLIKKWLKKNATESLISQVEGSPTKGHCQLKVTYVVALHRYPDILVQGSEMRIIIEKNIDFVKQFGIPINKIELSKYPEFEDANSKIIDNLFILCFIITLIMIFLILVYLFKRNYCSKPQHKTVNQTCVLEIQPAEGIFRNIPDNANHVGQYSPAFNFAISSV